MFPPDVSDSLKYNLPILIGDHVFGSIVTEVFHTLVPSDQVRTFEQGIAADMFR